VATEYHLHLACKLFSLQLVIYGISGAFVPQEALLDQSTPGAIHNITQYIETYLIPGGPTVPINAIITAVNDGELNQVATAFDQALAHNYTQQLISLATSVRQAQQTVPSVAFEQASCS